MPNRIFNNKLSFSLLILKRYGLLNIVALSTIIKEPGYDNAHWPRGKHSCSYYVAQMLVIWQRAMNSEHLKIYYFDYTWVTTDSHSNRITNLDSIVILK